MPFKQRQVNEAIMTISRLTEHANVFVSTYLVVVVSDLSLQPLMSSTKSHQSFTTAITMNNSGIRVELWFTYPPSKSKVLLLFVAMIKAIASQGRGCTVTEVLKLVNANIGTHTVDTHVLLFLLNNA